MADNCLKSDVRRFRKGRDLSLDRFQVVSSGGDNRWCVVDTNHPLRRRDPSFSPRIRWHESVGWNATFDSRADAQKLADACNAKPFDVKSTVVVENGVVIRTETE